MAGKVPQNTRVNRGVLELAYIKPKIWDFGVVTDEGRFPLRNLYNILQS